MVSICKFIPGGPTFDALMVVTAKACSYMSQEPDRWWYICLIFLLSFLFQTHFCSNVLGKVEKMPGSGGKNTSLFQYPRNWNGNLCVTEAMFPSKEPCPMCGKDAFLSQRLCRSCVAWFSSCSHCSDQHCVAQGCESSNITFIVDFINFFFFLPNIICQWYSFLMKKRHSNCYFSKFKFFFIVQNRYYCCLLLTFVRNHR